MSIYIGPAGWSYNDWKGLVYPYVLRPADYLTYLSGYFDIIEIDSSYYRPPTEKMALSWLDKVQGNPTFRFTMKLWSEFTHNGGAISKDKVDFFKKGAGQLLKSKRLSALLAQFHFSFDDNFDNRQKLKAISESFTEYPVVAEFRHISWAKREALEYVKSLGVGFCNIDQPASRNSISGTDFLTSEIGYIRLHGRNSDAWFEKGATVEEKYNYLYPEDELGYWIEVIKKLSVKLRELYVIFNNHYQGKAVVNALQLKSKLSGQLVQTPEPLYDKYPVLKKFTRMDTLSQKRLF